nr:response regulator [Oscillatoria laete-virens]
MILDLTIQGGMGGIETLRRLKQIDPDVKAIASSGYSEEETSLEFSQLGFSAVLPKPYRLADLSRILAEVTAENSGNV